ncbi:helix-turn-helix domain-containing protein [Kibdelosporangium aridum]|uniref:helix-turn-helix domain-containing protein n=1 Tax=Kibdelosporangium aridum TaxID=2030 RepID=UPI0007C54639
MERRNELRGFLQSRRARLRPQDLGIRSYGARRVPGLRREELAELAGVSTDYYIRLEQGRNRKISSTALDSIARTLRLTEVERTHLHNLVRPPADRTLPLGPEPVLPGLQRLLDAMPSAPAYVVGRKTDVLAWNSRAATIFGDFGALPESQRNMARIVFLDPKAREFYSAWEQKAIDVCAYLRLSLARNPGDAGLKLLISDLMARSTDFRPLWSRQVIHEKTTGHYQFQHPVLGRLTMHYRSLRLPEEPGQNLIAFTEA